MPNSTIALVIGWLGMAVCAPGVAWAQTAVLPEIGPANSKSATIVREFLQSPDTKTQAWGAWYAGRDAMTFFVPDLIAVASRHVNGGTLAERAARDIALDALIQLRARVPADFVARLLLEDEPTSALILAARIEGAHDALLDFVRARPEGGEEWFAAANLLLSRNQAGFARVLVDKLALDINVYVSDDGGTSGVGGMDTSIGCGAAGQGDPALPPWAVYTLTTAARPDVAILATGPVSVYYERHLSPAGMLPSAGSTSIHGPSSEQRLQYVAALMGTGENDLPVRGRRPREIKWRDQPSLDAAIRSFRDDTRRGFIALVKDLVEADLIPKEEAADIEPVIRVTVHDVRTGRSTPLTTPAGMP